MTSSGSGTGTPTSAGTNITYGQVYCTVGQLIDELRLSGFDPNEAALLNYCKRASAYLNRKFGHFIPVTETRYFDGTGETHVWIDPLLGVDSLTLDGDAITSTQYLGYPRGRHWRNGPYTRLSVDPDATELSTWTLERDVLAVTGRWGLWEEYTSSGASVANTTQIAAGGTSLQVANGSLISAGMVLLIGSEQLLVTATGSASDSTANTNGAIAAADDTIVLTDGTQVSTGETIRVETEQMKVLDVVSNTLYVQRGWNGTARAAHTTNQDVYVYRAYTVTRGVNGTTATAHANGTAINRYLPPPDVVWLALQVAGLMKKKADSGFAGKTGDPTTGEVFYFNEFPAQVKEIGQNYRIVSL